MNAAEIWNTPGYFYAIGYALSTIVIFFLQRPAIPKWRKWLQSTGMLAFLLAFMLLTPGATGLSYVVDMSIIIAFIYFNIRSVVPSGMKAGFLCIKAFIFGEFSASLCWQIYYFVAMRWSELWNWRWRLPIMLVVFVVMKGLFLLMEGALCREGMNLQIGRRELWIAILTASSVYVVSNMSYLNPDGIFSGRYARDIFTIRTLVDLSGVALIYAFHSQLIEVQMRLEKDALHNIMQMQYQSYTMSRESMDMVNQKYHDLKHQIALLKAQTDSQKSMAYLKQMERDIQSYEAQNQTGNPVLDAVLSGKSIYCQRHGIELKFITDGKLLNFMEDMEISALFGNMLDNAIESVERLSDPEQRLIRLYIDGEKQFLRIRMENYCTEQVRFENGLPVTNKRDKRYHGFGMKSMQKTVTKYGGSLLTGQNNNWFELKILIPIPG